jgi:hypothetical protein
MVDNLISMTYIQTILYFGERAFDIFHLIGSDYEGWKTISLGS